MAPELDLVEDGDQITHRVGLDDVIDKQEHLDVFHVDENFVENEETWNKIKMAILGEDSESESESGSEEEEESEESSHFCSLDPLLDHRVTFLPLLREVRLLP